MIKLFISVALFLVFISSCTEDTYKEVLPMTFNLEKLNTTYDDFNSAGPSYFSFSNYQFIYSTNFSSAGKQFDIWQGEISINTSMSSDIIDIHSCTVDAFKSQPFLQNTCNSPYDEYGPYLWAKDKNANMLVFFNNNTVPSKDFAYLFSSNRKNENDSGSLNVYFYDKTTYPKKAPFNSQGNDAYACFFEKHNTIIFCSDRDGVFNIYQSTVSKAENIYSILQAESLSLVTEPVSILNSEYDDKCPYILDNILVFVSNRGGKHDQFDIYYSIFENNSWSTPVCMPSEMIDEDVEVVSDNPPVLNTKHNEYRPILAKSEGFLSDTPYIIIYSSDRPHGKGGYDLYLSVLPDTVFE